MSQDVEFTEAVAVVGMSCRFAPDLDSPDKFWEFLINGRDSVREMPEKRWISYAATSPQATNILRNVTRKGAYLDDIEGFDADFFGISPREADFLDPQQRIVLELAWEALVNAGLPPHALRNSEAGVFVSANSNDYGRRLLEDISRTGAYAVNGTTYYGIANRISYFLDLRGPSLAVDTACAGSLTAVHLACQSLRAGETPVAIVGGVNIMSSPTLNVALEGAGALAPDGKSKAFDAAADGYGRGEGAGVVILKRLADARRDGDDILAVVAGGGVFQDGRSDGMMAPNGDAQVHMLRQAYQRAGIAPDTVGYVEAHGTGTPVGDREEANALATVFGAGRAEDPCLIGSVKPNIGHVEAASGIAGMIKTILALRNDEIPPSLHSAPNPEFDWANSGLRLVGERRAWPAGDAPRVAGVSSYGVGGSIAHVILADSPAEEVATQPLPAARPAVSVFPLSAASDAGVRALAGRTADWLLANPSASPASVGYTLARRRSHLPQRAAVVAGSVEELTDRLRSLADGNPAPGVVTDRVPSTRDGGAVWVFSGHGAQWSGMGRQLLVDEPVFAEAIDGLADVFRAELGWTPREAIVDGGPWSASHVQAMTFAIQIGLAAVWQRHGVEPDAVIGHSVGEIAAAVVAGALDVQEAARFACRRAAALQPLAGRGGMALVSLPFDEVRERLAGRSNIEAAISASPGSTVVSGSRDAVATLAEQWKADGLGVWHVDTDIAFHSAHVDEVVPQVAAAADELTARTPRIPLYSTALADPRATDARDSAYWVANLRQPVRCAQAVTAAIEDGHRVFLEVSSHPVVAHSIKETLQHLDIDEATVCCTLRRDADELTTLLTGLAELYCADAGIDWTREHPDGTLAPLPPVAWQHRPYWIFDDGAGTTGGIGGGHDPQRHSLLGGKMTVSGSPARTVWQTHLDMDCRPYPLSHEVVGVEITPAASIINTFAEAATRDGASAAITDIVLRTPLSVVPPRVVQIVRSENTLRLSTRLADDGSDGEQEWITHTTAAIDPGTTLTVGEVDVDALRERLPEYSWEQVDTMFRRMGVGGYAFPWDLDELRRTDSEQLAVMTIEPDAEHATSWAHVIDGALTISAVVVTPEDAPVLWMSRSIEKVVFDGLPPARIKVHSRRSPRSPRDTTDVQVADETGRIVCEVTGLRFAEVEHLGGTTTNPRELVHEIAWRPIELAESAADIEQVLLVGDPALTEVLAAQLETAGMSTLRVCHPDPHTHVPHQCNCTADLGPALLAKPGAVVVAPSIIRPGEVLETATERASWTVIRTMQRISEIVSSSGDLVAPQRIWSLSRGVRSAAAESSLAHGPLWGISRIVAGEHPELWGGAVDVERVEDSTGERLLEVLRHAGDGAEDVISLADDGTYVARLTQIERPTDSEGLRCRAGGTYLITGGLGGIGLEVAHWLADRGARRILLAGRRGLPPRAEWANVADPQVRQQIDAVLALEAAGVTVAAVAVDITDEEAVATALDPATHGLPPIRGVIHAAGVVNDALVDKVDRDGLRDVLAPKARGGLVLHRLFPAGTLDFFVLFSSCGQFARLTGQTNYAAANSFLDALAAHRNAGGHTDTISIGWTSWRGVGMSESIASTMFEANARGLEAISAADAFRAWAFAERYHASYQAILRVLPVPAHTTRVPMFRDLAAIDGELGQAEAGSEVDWTSLPEAEALTQITGEVQEQVGAELNLAAPDVDLRRPLVELGVDSVMTVGLRVRLGRRFGLDLPPTILWAKPTVAALSQHITETLRGDVGNEEQVAPAAA